MTMPSLAARVRSLLAEATRSYTGRPAQRELLRLTPHLDGPLRVAIAGRVKAGKSTLLNALVGARVAATDAGECTRVVTWYANGPALRAVAHPHADAPAPGPGPGPGPGSGLGSGDPRGRPGPGHRGPGQPARQPLPLGVVDHSGHLMLQMGQLQADQLDRIEVWLPSRWLDQMTLIDTPGMGSLTESAGRRTQDFLSDTGGVDAVLYLLRHLHSSDVDFLDTFREASASETTPVNAVGVLSRADEVGGGGAGALDHARRVAGEYRADPRIRGLVHTVLPVAGLLAETAATMTDADHADLAALARAGESATASLFLSATRFMSPSRAVPVSVDARRRLLGLLGMYGVRLAVDAIARGAVTRDELRLVLHEHSGLGELRRLLLTQFAQRRDVLKAETVLRTIDAVTRMDPIPAAPRLRQSVERLRAGAHELTELRLLTELRMGTVPVRPEQLVAMERLLGGDGTSIPARLALRPDAPVEDARAVVTGLHAHWRRVAQNPLTDPALTRAAQVLQRTCEGLAAAIHPRPPT